MLCDFFPHGHVAQLYGIFNEERGTSLRAIFIIDKEGVIRFKKTYPPGELPEPSDIINIMEENSID